LEVYRGPQEDLGSLDGEKRTIDLYAQIQLHTHTSQQINLMLCQLISDCTLY